MKPRLTFSFLTGTLLAAATTGLVLAPTPGLAQQAAEVIGEVVVEAQADVKNTTARAGNDWRTVWEATRSIEYADLDLRLHEDVIELEVRIEFAAREVCEELANISPRLREPEPRCIREAVASTKKQLEKAITAAS